MLWRLFAEKKTYNRQIGRTLSAPQAHHRQGGGVMRVAVRVCFRSLVGGWSVWRRDAHRRRPSVMSATDGTAAAASASLIAQFESAEGERAGPQLDVPLDITSAQLQAILNQLLSNEEAVPYSFYIGDSEVKDGLKDALGDASTEQAVRIVYVPQAVFRVRAVTRCTSTLPGHAEALLSSSFSPDGRVLGTGSGDHCVRLWDVSTEMPKAALRAHRDWVLCIAWSPCGKYILSGGKDGLLALWSPTEEAPLRTIKAHKKWVNHVAWEPLHRTADGVSCRFASASKDGSAKLWDRATGRCLGTLSGHSNSVSCVRWCGDGLLCTGSHDRTIKVWAVDECKLVRSLEGHGHWVNCLALNTDAAMRAGAHDHRGVAPADGAAAVNVAAAKYAKAKGSGGELLASGSDDFTLFLWRPSEGKKALCRMTGHVQLVNAAAFSADGNLLASASFDGSVRLWSGRTGKFVATLRGHVGAVYQLAWSADSRLLASGSKDSTVKVWEVQSKKLLEDLPGHADEVFTVDWSPDGERVSSGGKDRNLKIWRR
jgi:ribosome assembly protein 4